MRQVLFVGGIHGSGKGTLCSKLAKLFALQHFSASQLIGWAEINIDGRNKRVDDISHMQSRLLDGLNRIENNGQPIILDGHFTLISNSDDSIKNVGLEVFKSINLLAVVVLTANAKEIKSRLRLRDGKDYSIELLESMQDKEVQHGHFVSESLDVPFLRITHDSIHKLEALVQKLINKNEGIT